MTTETVDALESYARAFPTYSRFTGKLEILCLDLLAAKGIDFHLLEARTKDVASFGDKIQRQTKNYSDPINEITDLSGLRIITYYQDAATEVGRLIECEFLVDELRSLVHTSTASEFGYRSSHYIVKINPARAELLEWNGLKELVAEIQVRTVLQHAWAAISHKLQYKREEDVPAVLKRKLFRLSALFELADDEFVSLREASGQVTKEIVARVSMGERKLAIDKVSLSQLIENSAVVAEICAHAAEIGFDFSNPEYHYEDDDRDTVSDLIQLAETAGIKTIEDFEVCLEAAIPWVRDYLDAQYTEPAKRGGSTGWHVTPPFVCELVLIGAQVQHYRIGHLLRLGFSRSIAQRVHDVAMQFKTEA